MATSIIDDFNVFMRSIKVEDRKYIAHWLLNDYVQGSKFDMMAPPAKKTAFKEIRHNLKANGTLEPFLTRLLNTNADYARLMDTLAHRYQTTGNRFDFLNDPYTDMAIATFTFTAGTPFTTVMPPRPVWETYREVTVHCQNGGSITGILSTTNPPQIICWENIPAGVTPATDTRYHLYKPAAGGVCVYVSTTLGAQNTYGSSKYYNLQPRQPDSLYTVVFIPEIRWIVFAMNGTVSPNNLQSFLDLNQLVNFNQCMALNYTVIMSGTFLNLPTAPLGTVLTGLPLKTALPGQPYSILTSAVLEPVAPLTTMTDAVSIVTDAFTSTVTLPAKIEPGANNTAPKKAPPPGTNPFKKLVNMLDTIRQNDKSTWDDMMQSIDSFYPQQQIQFTPKPKKKGP